MKLNNQHSFKKKKYGKGKEKKIRKSKKNNLKRKKSIFKKLFGGSNIVVDENSIQRYYTEKNGGENYLDPLTYYNNASLLKFFEDKLKDEQVSNSYNSNGVFPHIINIEFPKQNNYSGEYIYQDKDTRYSYPVWKKNNKFTLFRNGVKWYIVDGEHDKKTKGDKEYRFFQKKEQDNNYPPQGRSDIMWEESYREEWVPLEEPKKPIITHKKIDGTTIENKNKNKSNLESLEFKINIIINKEKEKKFIDIVLNRLEEGAGLSKDDIIITFHESNTEHEGGSISNKAKRFRAAARSTTSNALKVAGKTAKTQINRARRGELLDKKRPVVATIKIYSNNKDNLLPKDKLLPKIEKIFGDEKTINNLKQSNIEILGKVQLTEVPDKLKNSNSEISRPKKYTKDDKRVQKELFNMIIGKESKNDQQIDNVEDNKKNKLMNIKKSLSIVYELDDIMDDDEITKLIEKYDNNSEYNFSKYIEGSDATVVKLFKMYEGQYKYTHVLISKDIGGNRGISLIPQHTMLNLLELFSGVTPTEWRESDKDRRMKNKAVDEYIKEQEKLQNQIQLKQEEDKQRKQAIAEKVKEKSDKKDL